MRGVTMDHEMVAQTKMTEKYLLNELDPQARDEFEEHFFECAECALDVHSASLFIENSKLVLAETPVEAAVASTVPVPAVPRDRFAWLRPALIVPVLAMLLAVVAYQNLVTYPGLKSAANSPQVLPWASINVGSYGSTEPVIAAAPGKGFLVLVRIPPESSYVKYSADLYNPSGKLEWSLTIPAVTGQDQWPIAVPGADRQPGTYLIAVHGFAADGTSKEMGQGSFELKIQK
jgi:hypothetical protein